MPRFDNTASILATDALNQTYNDYHTYLIRRLHMLDSLQKTYERNLPQEHQRRQYMPAIRQERECIRVLSKALDIWFEQKGGDLDA